MKSLFILQLMIYPPAMVGAPLACPAMVSHLYLRPNAHAVLAAFQDYLDRTGNVMKLKRLQGSLEDVVIDHLEQASTGLGFQPRLDPELLDGLRQDIVYGVIESLSKYLASSKGKLAASEREAAVREIKSIYNGQNFP